jgi:hypothetical protein
MVTACTAPPTTTTTVPAGAPSASPAAFSRSVRPLVDATATTVTPAAAELDPDGNDDPEDTGTGTLPESGHFERVGIPPLSLERICDLTPFEGSLYAVHANQPLGTDGATVTRYSPVHVDAGRPRSPFHVAFDWNRIGEPAKGGGAGQGFLRIRAIDGRLFVPDADPPYDGFGLADHGTEGYVFVSDRAGGFARAVGEHAHPPGPPKGDGSAGAAVLPRAYHDLDVIKFRGRLYASTGAVPPKERAWVGPSPGALLVANDSLSRFTYEIDYPFPWQNGVWRLGYLVRFKDRLFVGIQDYDGREPNDYVVFSPPKGAAKIERSDVHAHRVSAGGALQTLRWYADRGRLYWVTLSREGEGALRVSDDGETWHEITFPDGAGRPTDVTRFRDSLVALTEHGLYRLEGDTTVSIAKVSDKKSPFVVSDFFCAAPLAVFDNELYAGGQRGGALYRLAADGRSRRPPPDPKGANEEHHDADESPAGQDEPER